MMNRRMEVLEEVVERCKTVLGENLVSVVLFGSVARGLEDSRSDIDLLIVVDKDVESDLLKDIHIEILLEYSVKLDMILMDKQDVIDNFEHFSPLFLSFVLGVSVLVDNDFFEKVYLKFLNRLKEENIKYVEGGKVWDLREISPGILQYPKERERSSLFVPFLVIRFLYDLAILVFVHLEIHDESVFTFSSAHVHSMDDLYCFQTFQRKDMNSKRTKNRTRDLEGKKTEELLMKYLLQSPFSSFSNILISIS